MYHHHQSRPAWAQNRGCGAWKHGAAFHNRPGAFWGAPNQASVSVNIREKADYYELFVFAPGRTKDAFNVQVADDVLVISAAASPQADARQWLHHEFDYAAFERRFQLNGKIDTDSIAARYTDGVLELTLPKVPGTAAQAINVA